MDICHAAQADGAHPFRVGTEWVRLHLQVGGRPIRVRYPSRIKPHADQWSQGSGHKPGDDCLVPQGFRTQVAIPFSKAALLTKYPNLTDRDVVSVEPAFGSAEARTFHSNNPHTVTLPGEMFKKGGELKRMEWAEVPTNGYGSLAGVNSPFLTMNVAADLQPKVITSMETEAEFTLAGDPATAERALLEMLKTVDSMAQTGGAEDPAAKARLEDFLGASLLKGCQWHLERKAKKYDVTDANNEQLADPKGFDISPARPELAELGLGRPGILYDTYLHVGPGGVIRQRDNFAKEGIVSVKGGHKRQGPFMVRYNRQVECNKELPVQDGALSRGPELEALLYSDAVNFQDSLFHYPSSGSLPQAWTPDSGPSLSPQLRVKSERYRYLFVRKQQGGADNRPVMIELSFDLSTGQALDAQGNPKGSPVQTVGCEFGLDHLGASAGKEMNEERAEGTQAPKSNAPGSSAGPQKGLKQPSGPVLHRTWHDRLDLDHPTLFTRPAFTLFAELVSTVTPKLCSTLPINVAGEKAATMMSRLQAGESDAESPGESAATIFKNTP